MTNGEQELLNDTKQYYTLVNSIRDLCSEMIEEQLLCCEDIISALDRVKMEILINHTQCSIKEENDNGKNFTLN